VEGWEEGAAEEQGSPKGTISRLLDSLPVSWVLWRRGFYAWRCASAQASQSLSSWVRTRRLSRDFSNGEQLLSHRLLLLLLLLFLLLLLLVARVGVGGGVRSPCRCRRALPCLRSC